MGGGMGGEMGGWMGGCRNGWMGGRRVRDGWAEGWVNGWVCKKLITDLDMRNGHKGGVKVGFIYIKDMNNNDGGKGGAYVYEAYEAK